MRHLDVRRIRLKKLKVKSTEHSRERDVQFCLRQTTYELVLQSYHQYVSNRLLET